MRRGNFVQLIEQRDSGPLLSVDRHWCAFIEANFHFRRLVGGFFRRNDPLPHRLFGLVRGIFEHAAFVAQVPDVAVARVNIRLGLLDRYVVRLRVGDGVLTRVDGPLAPRRDDFHAWRDGFVGQFKPHLIVALARAAVGDRVSAGFERDFRLALGQHGPRHRCAQQILVFVHRARAQGWPDVLGQKFFAQVFDRGRGRPGRERLALGCLQILLLADVAYHGNYFATVRFLEPRNND